MDPPQPTFGEGGWFVAHEYRQRAVDAVVQIESSHRPRATELKGADLVKTRRGQALMREVSEAVGAAGGVPYIYVVEKRYAVGSKIVETFFDPVYNPAIPNSDP